MWRRRLGPRSPERTPHVSLSAAWLASAVAIIFLLGTPSLTQAEEAQAVEKFPERFMIRGGWNYVFNADTLFSINGAATGIGVTVDFARTLGGQREDSLWRIDSLYRFNPRHSVGFSYYNVRRKGLQTLGADLNIDEVTYGAGATVRSELTVNLYRFMYNYSFHHDAKSELALSLGMYVADIGVSLSANLTCTGRRICGVATPLAAGGSTSTLTVPLPTIGFLVNYHFTPRLMAQARVDWFYIEWNQFKGSASEVYLGLEYRLFRHFSLGAAFDRLDVDVKNRPEDSTGWRVENDWNTLYLYGALYF